ncbi:MAG TPA: hypothetical protein VFW07_04885 [Parafilimonas sp.]|nr:hypothetical protein [Parafilimonas sp.]
MRYDLRSKNLIIYIPPYQRKIEALPLCQAILCLVIKHYFSRNFSNPVQHTQSTTITNLIGFQFAENAQLQNSFSLPVTINDTTKDMLQVISPVFIPRQSIKAPQGTKQIHLNIAAGSCSTINTN